MPHAQESAACQWARPAGRPSPNSRLRWSCAAGAGIREFPPVSVMRGRELEPFRRSSLLRRSAAWVTTWLDVDEVFRGGGPALHVCLGPTGIRSARLSQRKTPVPTKNQSAVTGPGPSLDVPCRTHRKARPASELGLMAVRPRFPLTLVIRGRGRGPRIPSYIAHARTGGDRVARR